MPRIASETDCLQASFRAPQAESNDSCEHFVVAVSDAVGAPSERSSLTGEWREVLTSLTLE